MYILTKYIRYHSFNLNGGRLWKNDTRRSIFFLKAQSAFRIYFFCPCQRQKFVSIKFADSEFTFFQFCIEQVPHIITYFLWISAFANYLCLWVPLYTNSIQEWIALCTTSTSYYEKSSVVKTVWINYLIFGIMRFRITIWHFIQTFW